MEAVIVIVGFLGAGKTTLLKHLIESFLAIDWKPYVVLNDYENAHLDSEQLPENLAPESVKALHGSCICCSGVGELRDFVNRIPERDRGVTLIEANGTSDAVALMGFLGVGLKDRFLPPVQVSVVDVKNWQQRGLHDELEANQIQVSSLVILTHLDKASDERRKQVESEVKQLNPLASIIDQEQLDVLLLPKLKPSENQAAKIDHNKAHWASCSVDLPHLPHLKCIQYICDALPSSILRVKGCTKLGDDETYTYFERSPDGKVYVRAYRGTPVTGPKLLTIGPGSNPIFLNDLVSQSIENAKNEN